MKPDNYLLIAFDIGIKKAGIAAEFRIGIIDINNSIMADFKIETFPYLISKLVN
jgi:hypothetical protein